MECLLYARHSSKCLVYINLILRMTLLVSAIVIHLVDEDGQAQKGAFRNEPVSQSSWAVRGSSGSLAHHLLHYTGVRKEHWRCVQSLSLLLPPLCYAMARNSKCSPKCMVRIMGTKEGQDPIDTCR